MEAVLHRDQIGILKVEVGISRCYYLFVTIALLTLIIGILGGFTECRKNPQFNKSISGSAAGI